MQLLLRLLTSIPVGFIAACLSAGTFFTLAVLVTEPSGPDYRFHFGELLIVIMRVAEITGKLALIPALIVIVLAETLSWRSVFFYVSVGGGIAFWISAPRFLQNNLGATILATGCLAGFVYWLIAGRSAGLAQDRP